MELAEAQALKVGDKVRWRGPVIGRKSPTPTALWVNGRVSEVEGDLVTVEWEDGVQTWMSLRDILLAECRE